MEIKQEPIQPNVEMQQVRGVDGTDPGGAEFTDPVSLEDKILELCSGQPQGITDDMIVTAYPGIDSGKRLKALQRLLSTGRLDLYKQGAALLYRLKTTTTAAVSKAKGFEMEERLVYQIIEDAGNRGIWIRDIRQKSNLVIAQVNKILKVLESKELIKAVKSVQASKKKVYMLYDLTPDESITGGAWYTDQDFETEFVDVLNQNCLRFLQQKAFKAERNHGDPISRRDASYAKPDEVWKFITELGISRVSLTVHNIETILNTLVYDGKAESTVHYTGPSLASSTDTSAGVSGDCVRVYRLSNHHVASSGLGHIPCGVCPVIQNCHDGGAVSPTKCQYMKEWLQF